MDKRDKTTKSKADLHDVVSPLLDALYGEIKELSKKKQDGSLNLLKVKKINQILGKCKEVLADEPDAEFLDILDEDTLPTNSDAVLILSQFTASMDRFKSSHHGWNGHTHCWNY